jgi:hypothetical protein
MNRGVVTKGIEITFCSSLKESFMQPNLFRPLVIILATIIIDYLFYWKIVLHLIVSFSFDAPIFSFCLAIPCTYGVREMSMSILSLLK